LIRAGFLYPLTQDSVLQVSTESFHTCNLSSTPLLKLDDDGNSVFNLTDPGHVYFISGEPKHCRKAQKVWADGTKVQPGSEDLAPTPGALPAGTVSVAPQDRSPSANNHASAGLRALATFSAVLLHQLSETHDNW
jgi:hypothetical protein